MNKSEFVKLMHFPVEWITLEMYPDELFQWQLAGYEPGHEGGLSTIATVLSIGGFAVNRPR